MKKINVLISLLLVLLLSTNVLSVSAVSENKSKTEKYASGLILSTSEDVSNNIMDAERIPKEEIRDSIPSSVDLSLSNYFPPIGNQGNIGSCTSWATAYYQFGYQIAAMNNWDAKHDFTKCFSPKFIYNIVKDNYNESSSYYDNYTILQNHGAVRYSEFEPSSEYTLSEINEWCINTNCLENALRNRISATNEVVFSNSFMQTPITSPYSTNLSIMKHLISTGHVLAIETYMGNKENLSLDGSSFVGNSLWRFGLASNGEIVCKECVNPPNNNLGHAMTVVGYDDNIWYDYNQNGLQEDFELGAFKLANSWGTDYCNNGFIWVMYDALNKQSNFSSSSGRFEAFVQYQYHYIEVASFDLELIAKVTVSNNSREDIGIDLGISSLSQTVPSTYMTTIFNQKGGPYPIEGIGLNSEATIPFDYGTFINGARTRKCYYLSLGDYSFNNSSTTISKVQFIDKTGHIVVDDTSLSSLNSSGENPFLGRSIPDTELRRYRIGMLGDVDNNATVDLIDSTLIQRYIARIIDLTDDDIVTADTDGNGEIDVLDAFTIQALCANVNLEGAVENGYLCAGYFVNLDNQM